MKTMNIPAPKVKRGELVWVLNYRSHRKDGEQVWETGIVYELSYESRFGGKFSWSYGVRLERISVNGHPLTLSADNDTVKKYKKGANSSQD